MYYEYPYIIYFTPVLAIVTYVIMVVGRKKVLGRIYRFYHTMTKYVLEKGKRGFERKWLLNLAVTLTLIVLVLLAMTMPYTTTKQYVVAQQRMETMLSIRRKIPVIIALDSSGSMFGDKLYYAKKTIEMYVNAVAGKALVGFIAFSDYVRVAIPPTSNKELLLERLEMVKAGGGTIYSEPLATALKWLTPYAEFNITSTIIFVTDGLPFPDDIPVYRNIVYKCALKNITIYPIYIETQTESKYERQAAEIRLKEMATITGGKLYTVENIGELIHIFEKLAEETIKRAGNYTVSTRIKYPVEIKSYLVHEYIAIVFVLLVLNSVARLLTYKITF